MLYPIRALSVICLVFALLAGCREQAAPTPRDYARVRTLPVTVAATGVTFRGELFFNTPEGVTDHGFVWSTFQSPVFGADHSQSIGARAGTGTFSIAPNANVQKRQVYYIRAFAKSGRYTVYGPELTFQW